MLKSLDRPFECILVDDGSPDSSWAVVSDIASERPWIRPVRLTRNFGQHNALLCGLRLARHPSCITIDDDLQHPPERIPDLLEALGGADVVYAVPVGAQHGFMRDIANVIVKSAMRQAGVARISDISGFRAVRTDLRQAFADYNGPYVNLDLLLTWGGGSFATLPVEFARRRHGRSTYTYRKLFVHTANLVLGFSTWPLRLASYVGLGATVLGVLSLAYVLGRYLISGTTVAGFTFLASTISIFSGAQLFALGVIGEYISRIYSQALTQPAYVIRIGGPEGEAALDQSQR